MSAQDELLAACVAAPDDDAPRLVWADAVGGERGELVVIQCRLAREDLPPAEAGALLRRADELLAAHGKAWSGFAKAPAVKRCLFRRGFVEAVEADVTAMPWPAIFKRAPLVTTLEVKGITQHMDYRAGGRALGPDPVTFLAEMFAQPAFERLRGLGLDGVATYEVIGRDEWQNQWTWRTDELLALIARTGHLVGLRALALHDRFTERGMHDLLASNVLPSLERLVIDKATIAPDQARELLANLPNLRALDIGSNIRLADVADVVPPTLVELRVGLGSGGDASLFEMQAAARLERLFVSGELSPHLEKFGVFERLRALDVCHTAVSGPNQRDQQRRAIARFTRASLPALRELRGFADLTPDEGLAIADAYGAQLACLDIRGQSQLNSPALHERITGYVRTGSFAPSETFLHVGTNLREPWLGHGIVVLQR